MVVFRILEEVLQVSIIYKKAGINDIDMLVKTRIEILRAINKLINYEDMTLFEENVRSYYETSLKDGKSYGVSCL